MVDEAGFNAVANFGEMDVDDEDEEGQFTEADFQRF